LDSENQYADDAPKSLLVVPISCLFLADREPLFNGRFISRGLIGHRRLLVYHFAIPFSEIWRITYLSDSNPKLVNICAPRLGECVTQRGLISQDSSSSGN